MIFHTQKKQNNTLYWLLFFFAVILLPIDGFPLGILYLREFGARPSNFIVLILACILFLIAWVVKRHLVIKIDKIFLYISVVLLLIFSVNFLVVVFKEPITRVYYREPLVSWILQYFMVLWMFLSIYIWLLLFRKLELLSYNYKKFLSILVISAIFNIVLFFDDIIYLHFYHRVIPFANEILEFLRGNFGMRAAGLATEPSLWGSWVVFIWPLLFFIDTNRSSYNYYYKFIAIVLIILGFISNARTFMIIFVMQATVMVSFIFLQKNYHIENIIKKLVIILIIVFGFISIIDSYIFIRMLSIFDVGEELSTTVRLGSTLTSLNAIVDNFLVGIGLGQFSDYYSQYVPDIALASLEVQAFIAGNIEHRASTFNLFTRVAVETGFINGVIFLVFIFIIFKRVFSFIKINQYQFDINVSVFLSMVGGVGFWITQDQFGYQPALFSLAMGIYLFEKEKYEKQFYRYTSN